MIGKSELKLLSGNYNRGYTRAIMDMQEVLNYIVTDLKHHHKRLNDKLCKELLQCFLENREKLRENLPGFIRWNCVSNKFEYYSPAPDHLTKK